MNKSAQPDEDADWSQATPGVDYLCFDLYMRMQNPRKIYITETSALTPLDSVLTRDNETNKSSNPSTYGNFSKDCMIGATRFSVNSADGTENKLKCIHSDGFLSDFCCGNLILLRNRFYGYFFIFSSSFYNMRYFHIIFLYNFKNASKKITEAHFFVNLGFLICCFLQHLSSDCINGKYLRALPTLTTFEKVDQTFTIA